MTFRPATATATSGGCLHNADGAYDPPGANLLNGEFKAQLHVERLSRHILIGERECRDTLVLQCRTYGVQASELCFVQGGKYQRVRPIHGSGLV
jgi:hypothetical protein